MGIMSVSTHLLQDSGEEWERTEELEDRRRACERLASAHGGSVTAAVLPIQDFHRPREVKIPA